VKKQLYIKNKNILKKNCNKEGRQFTTLYVVLVQTAASVSIILELVMYVKVIHCSREFEYV